jgi:hypothetical protein
MSHVESERWKVQAGLPSAIPSIRWRTVARSDSHGDDDAGCCEDVRGMLLLIDSIL